MLVKDYYSILKVSANASPENIKLSYKKLAKMYHPDKNPGNIHAEEEFKLINEAYQILSDPTKKSQYDNIRLYSSYQSKAKEYNYQPSPKQGSSKTSQPFGGKKRYYQKPSGMGGYIIDKEYYKVATILLFIFFGMIASAFGIYYGKIYLDYREDLAESQRAKQMVDSLNQIIKQEKYSEAIKFSSTLIKSFPMNFKFYGLRDSVVNVLESKAHKEFQKRNYGSSLQLFHLINRESPTRLYSIMEEMMYSYAYTGKIDSAELLVKKIVDSNPNDILPRLTLAKIHFDILENPQEALKYADWCKTTFRKLMRESYGNAFELVIDGPKSPEMYFNIFSLRTRINLELSNFEEAYRDANWMVFFRPDNPSSYELRIISSIKSNITTRLCEDINNYQELTNSGSYEKQKDLCPV